uniref:GN3L_Grn1 domain-containing protein n=1 Tax=Panagrellus redivivus TaxID=6233 RepID=A0A7E4VY21_PANRE
MANAKKKVPRKPGRPRKRVYRKQNLSRALAAWQRICAEKRRLKELEKKDEPPTPKPKPKPIPKPRQRVKHVDPAMKQRLDNAKQKRLEKAEKQKADYARVCERLRLARQAKKRDAIPSTPQPFGPLKRSFRLRISDEQ